MKPLVFVMGCQRSGTTAFADLFRQDPATAVFPEQWGPMNRRDDPEGLRLVGPEAIRKAINEAGKGRAVCRPLVESQNARTLLDAMPEAHVVWMLRSFRDVADSHLRTWGHQSAADNVERILSGRCWRGETLAAWKREGIADLYAAGGLSAADHAAIFWWVRNQFYLSQGLGDHPRVMLVRYEAIASEPERQAERVRRFLPSGFRLGASGFRGDLIGIGDHLRFDPAVASMCEELDRDLSPAVMPR